MTKDLSFDDFGVLCICAVRYALGRRSYMPSLVCKIIKENIDQLADRDLDILIRDIENPATKGFVDNPYGDACDEKEWMDLLKVVKEERFGHVDENIKTRA